MDGANENLEMVKDGFVEVYRGKPPRIFDLELYQKAEADAKKVKTGMWSLGDKYISPGDWRKIKKMND